MSRTGAQIVWDSLVREGVQVVFGYPGGAILPTYDALLGCPIQHVLVRHEQGATHMADGFARAGGEVGVVIGTSGPGATNMVTGIATAMMDSSPIVCITGQVASPFIGYDAFQEVDITGITIPITKHNYMVSKVEDIGPSIREAFHIARSGRPGPVLVDITKDAQQASTDWHPDSAPERPLPQVDESSPVSPHDLEQIVKLIEDAKSPVILAGRGILLSNAMAELLAFAEHIDAPVTTTLLGIGALPASHPLNLGMMGMHGESWVNNAIQEADLLIALGMRFDDRVTGNLKTYARNAKKIHVDIDASELNKNVPVDVGVSGDLRNVLKTITPIVSSLSHDDWRKHIGKMRGKEAVLDIKHMADTGHLYAAHVIHDIWRLTEGKAIVVTDVGQHQMWEAQYYHHDEPYSLITSGGLGTMGFALPAAIGARFACPDKEVWVVAGDGGIQMTQAELTTIAQENIKINVAIINNGYLGMVRQWQEFFYGGRYSATPLRSPDYVKLAEAHGLTGLRVSTRPEVEGIVTTAREDSGSVVIDFRVEQEDTVYPMVPSGADLNEMIRRPKTSVLAETGADVS
tara:strand:- start:4351 stop:6072 length:1722 start_codon:yes stop_codon:yes gene_type:complete